MRLLILTSLLAGSLAAPLMQTLYVHDDGSYKFFYETGKEGGSHSRTEIRYPDGVVEGKFSYEDPNGEIREVQYRADDSGYVANGDVSVEGAPKGQFPVATTQSHDTLSPPESSEKHNKPQESEPAQPKLEFSVGREEEADQEHNNEDGDIKDLSLEESTVDDPPEAFPPGFFHQNFQGLRRLPEPTPDKSTSTEATTAAPKKETPTKEGDDAEQPTPSTDVNEGLKKVANGNLELDAFMPIKPFQGFPQTDSSLLHQPVYVFSYQQPDSYGYHYFF